MHTIVDFTIVPVGVGVSLSKYIAACEQNLAETGLTYELHANGTNLEGEWEDVFAPSVAVTKPFTPWAFRASIPMSNSAHAPINPSA